MNRSELVAEAIYHGQVAWPADHKVHIVRLPDDEELLELVAGRRTHWPISDEDDWPASAGVKVGDLVAFERAIEKKLEVADGHIVPSSAEPALFQITHLWRHAGIAPDWTIASLRAVKLVAG